MSTSPDSQFVRTAAVVRRRRDGFDRLRGRTLTRVDGTGRAGRELTTADEWFGVLAGTFGITLADIHPAERAALWERVRADSAARRARRAGGAA